MAKVTLYSQSGENLGELTLSEQLFDVEPNQHLIHEALMHQKTNARQVVAHTKDRSEVKGSGKKPWRQKGTGRARHGDRQSPIWVGGGVTFGPRKTRNFSTKMNRKAKRKALAMILTDKVASDRFVAVDKLEIAEGKTKSLSQVISALPTKSKKTLIVLDPENINAARAARNIPRVSTISPKSLNVADLLDYDFVLAPKAAIEIIEQTYSSKSDK